MAKTREHPPTQADDEPVADRDAASEPEEPEEFAATRFGRLWISALLVILLAAMTLSATPESELTEVAEPWRQPITDVTGLFQSWDLFAPDPRSTTRRLEARLTYDDGTEAVWRPPTSGGRILGVYRSFRWRKWASRVMSDENTSLRAPAARYIASLSRREPGYPVEIVLVELTYEAPPPGSGQRRDPDPEWGEEILSTHRYSADGDILDFDIGS